MTKCPKCKKDIFEEAKFCPYCMTKFGDLKEYDEKIKRFNKKLIIIIFICIIVIGSGITMLIINNSNNKEKKDSDKKVTNINSENIKKSNDLKTTNNSEKLSDDTSDTTSISDDFIGTWFDENANGFPEEVGGVELNIFAIKDNLVLFSLELTQSPPASRIAAIYDYSAIINDGKAEFSFSDDGWGNAGSGTITFLSDNRIYVKTTFTKLDSTAMWDLSVDNYLKKDNENVVENTVDLMNVLGNEISVLETKIGSKPDMKYSIDENRTMYEYGGIEDENRTEYNSLITVLEENGKVKSIKVNYGDMNNRDKQKYNFSFGVNGESKYQYILNKYPNIEYQKDVLDDATLTRFLIGDELNSKLEVYYTNDEVGYMTYYYD
ncbi:MAG: zinc ribbon domain-containing protein [Lachnospiraceae bacterium]|nr:zinc ribbon domain-containing protein [Clostridiales bacterium]MDY2608429.1 zinc ribbon domain-containing protein [Lachnospiraceae bacterium]